MSKPTLESEMEQADRWTGSVERELVRVGVLNAHAAVDWLVKDPQDELEVELTAGDTGPEPWVQVLATWGPREEANYATVNLQLSWPKRRMVGAVAQIQQQYHDWLFKQGEAKS